MHGHGNLASTPYDSGTDKYGTIETSMERFDNKRKKAR